MDSVDRPSPAPRCPRCCWPAARWRRAARPGRPRRSGGAWFHCGPWVPGGEPGWKPHQFERNCRKHKEIWLWCWHLKTFVHIQCFKILAMSISVFSACARGGTPAPVPWLGAGVGPGGWTAAVAPFSKIWAAADSWPMASCRTVAASRQVLAASLGANLRLSLGKHFLEVAVKHGHIWVVENWRFDWNKELFDGFTLDLDFVHASQRPTVSYHHPASDSI